MIKPVTYEEIIKTLRRTIINNSIVADNRILNALSVRGTDLSDIISETKTYSFSAGDVFILFELLKDREGDNYVTPKDDDNMLVIASYTFHMMIYGNGSDACSQELRALFKNSSIALNLREEGIFVRTINSGETINEFINNTLLLRNDLELKIEVTFLIKNKTLTEYFKHENIVGDDITLIVEKV